jgi:hypothetical protein
MVIESNPGRFKELGRERAQVLVLQTDKLLLVRQGLYMPC